MTLSQSVKFFVQIFLNIVCIILAGWFGIQEVMVSGNLQLNEIRNLDLFFSGGCAALAFAVLSFFNLILIVVTRKMLKEGKLKKSSCLPVISHIVTLALVILGITVAVLLGLISTTESNSVAKDITFVSVVIAFILISILLQVSTFSVTGGCRKSYKLESSSRTDRDDLVQSSGSKARRVSFEKETSFTTPYFEDRITASNNNQVPRHFQPIPTIHVTSTELNVAKQKLRRSTGSSMESSFGTYRPPKLMPIVVEDLISESQDRLNRSIDSFQQDGRGDQNLYASANVISHPRQLLRTEFRESDRSSDHLSDDVFLPSTGFGQPHPMYRQWTTPGHFQSLDLESSRQISGSVPTGRSRQAAENAGSQTNLDRNAFNEHHKLRPRSLMQGQTYLCNPHYVTLDRCNLSSNASSRVSAPAIRLSFGDSTS